MRSRSIKPSYRAAAAVSSGAASQRVDRRSRPAIFRRLREACSPTEGPCGGTGRRARLKIEFRKECWFDSGQGHHPVALNYLVAFVSPRELAALASDNDSPFKPRGRILAAQLARVVPKRRPSKTEGAGKAGCSMRTRSLASEIKTGHERRHHRFAETIRPSLRDWF